MRCEVENSKGEQCDRDALASWGICKTHLYRLDRYNDVQADRPIRQYTMRVPRSYPRYPGDDEAERFWSRVVKTSNHWWWTGSLTGPQGVPQAMWGGYTRTAAQIIWELAHGPIEPNTIIRHTSDCGESDCVRLSHLTDQPARVEVPA
ncbi:hypothetical protein [Micromonospora sp. NPDC048839]|uniref:hypothetical protein n=1 Tax=Micromonospora sp. NPDC048839 TaxID=3155641 RepID=UPI0033DE6A07